MTDAIITRLASLQNLAVRPTNAVLKYSGAAADPTQAARELQVDSVVAGNYQATGGVIRVSVQLIDHGATRWASRYDLQGSDMLKFEDEVAQKVLDGLSVQLSGSEQERMKAPTTTSAHAYNLLLQARADYIQYYTTSRIEPVHEGERLAREAIAQDPSFAEAYAVLSDLCLAEGANFATNAAQVLQESERAARKAVELAPTSYDANSALGAILAELGKNAEAIRSLRRAVAVAPNAADGWAKLGYAYHYAGLTDSAEEEYRRALELNPALPRSYWMHSRMLLYQGKAHEAAEEIRQALQRTPDQYKLAAFLGYFLYYDGKMAEAEQAVERSLRLRGGRSGDDTPLLFAAYIHAARGERNQIDASILKVRPSDIADGDMAEWIGGVYALLGDKATAVTWLRRAVALGDHNYPWFRRDKNYQKLQGDPDFERLMSEAQGYWKQYTAEFGSR
jgi:serine/threonine-protein kinase